MLAFFHAPSSLMSVHFSNVTKMDSVQKMDTSVWYGVCYIASTVPKRWLDPEYRPRCNARKIGRGRRRPARPLAVQAIQPTGAGKPCHKG